MSSAEELKAKGNKALQSGNVKEWYNSRIPRDNASHFIFWKYQLSRILLIIDGGTAHPQRIKYCIWLKEAIDCYTEAIQKDGSNKVYFSNRSAAYMKSEDFRSALRFVVFEYINRFRNGFLAMVRKLLNWLQLGQKVTQEKVQLFTHLPVSKKQKLLMKKLPNSSLEIKLSKVRHITVYIDFSNKFFL